MAICAGAAHSCALTAPEDGGVLLAWHSLDPTLKAHEVGGTLMGQTVVAVSAGESRGMHAMSVAWAKLWTIVICEFLPAVGAAEPACPSAVGRHVRMPRRFQPSACGGPSWQAHLPRHHCRGFAVDHELYTTLDAALQASTAQLP